jgi:Holliday junction resolvase-like predicted endonuclease
MAQYSNLLHSPNDFKDHIDRNYEWMTTLYNNRKPYYEDLVRKQIQMAESNAILNELAKRNVYISLEELEDFQELGKLPTEFFDDTKKIVVKEGSIEYDEYLQLFVEVLINKDVKVSDSETYSKELNDKLEELEQEKQEQINKLEKVDTVVPLEEIVMPEKDKITLTQANNLLKNGEYLTFTNGNTGVEEIYYKDGENLKVNNIDGEIVNFDEINYNGSAASKYKIEALPNQEKVDEITKEFALLKAKLINDFLEKNKENLKSKTVTQDTDVNLIKAQNPKLYNELQEAFNNYNQEEGLNTEELDEEQVMNLFQNFVSANPIAENIINNYSEKNTNEETDYNFDYKLEGVQKNTKDLDLKGLQALKKTLELKLEKFKNADKPNLDAIQQFTELIEKIKKLEELKSFDELGYSEAMQKSINKIKELQNMQGNIQLSNEGYTINGVLHERVTRVMQSLKNTPYEYRDIEKVKASFDATIGKDGFNKTSINNFIISLRNKKLIGFSEFTYTEINDILNNLDSVTVVDEIYNTIIAAVKEKTFESSRIVGNYIDGQIKKVFNNEKIEFNEELIERKAYDNLFGPEGVITQIKNKVDSGELYVASENIRVFDSESKVAGEIDLLVVDKKGTITIVDVKTGSKDKWDKFNSKDSEFAGSKKEDYEMQQTAYSVLLEKMIGVKSKIAILPIEVTKDDETGRIKTAKSPSNKSLMSDGKGVRKDTFALSKDAVLDKVLSVIPLKEKVISTLTFGNKKENESNNDSIDNIDNQKDKTKEEEINTLKEQKKQLELFRQEAKENSTQEGVINQLSATEYNYSPPSGKQIEEDLFGNIIKVSGRVNGLNNNYGTIITTSVNEYYDKVVEYYDKEQKIIDDKINALEKNNEFVEKTTPLSLETIINRIEGAQSLEQLNEIHANLRTDFRNKLIDLSYSEQITEAINNKKSSFPEKNSSEDSLIIDQNLIKKGNNVYAKNAIFAKDGVTQIAEPGSALNIIDVKEVKGVTRVTVKVNKSQKTINMNELDKDFTTTEPLIKFKEDIIVSKENKENASESIDITETFSKDEALFTKLASDAEKGNDKDIEDDFLNDLKC